MKEAVVIDGVRTPFGRAGRRGMFRSITHSELMVPLIKHILKRNNLDPKDIDEFHVGSAGLVTPMSKCRQYLFEAGFGDNIWGSDVNTQCASGLHTTAEACERIMAGSADIILSAGVETMGRQGMTTPEEMNGVRTGGMMAQLMPPKSDLAYPPEWKDAELLTPWFAVKNPQIFNMLYTAENVHARYGITRKEADEWALRSQQLACNAIDAGRFDDEILPVTINYKDGTSETISKDQGPRRETNMEALAGLRPVFKEDGFVTAGNSCPQNDGATLCIVTTKEIAKERGWKPMLTYRGSAAVGVDPDVMGIGPRWATKKLLERNNMKIEQFDVIECNEAFACVVNYFINEFKLSDNMIERINRWGGAIAIGHPLGGTGPRLITTAGHQLKDNGGRWALTTLCQGLGMGYAAAWEREDY
ncbi:MAG: thiolase family protein [Dehalococcoidia bacterium]|jgi:acetyl-CoA acetyltransferase family protein